MALPGDWGGGCELADMMMMVVIVCWCPCHQYGQYTVALEIIECKLSSSDGGNIRQ